MCILEQVFVSVKWLVRWSQAKHEGLERRRRGGERGQEETASRGCATVSCDGL